MSYAAIPEIHIDTLQDKHILGISYRLKCYMNYISTINTQLHTDLISLFNIANIPNDLDILDIIKILITKDLTANALVNKIKVKLDIYLEYIRLDQLHDFDDPGRCIPKFSYNKTNKALNDCSKFIEDSLNSKITRSVNNATTLPGLVYYCLDTGLRESSSKIIKQRLDAYFQHQNNSASIATISQIVDSAGCSSKDMNADSLIDYLTEYEIYLYNIGFIFYQGFFNYLNDDKIGYFIIINQLKGQDKQKYIENKKFNIEIFNYKFNDNYKIKEFYKSDIIVGQNGFSLPNVCKWISNHMELLKWPPQQSGLSVDMISKLKISIGMSTKGYGDFGQIFMTTCLNNLDTSTSGKLNIFKGKIILFTVDTFLATLAIVAKCPFLLGTINNPCYLHNPIENIRNVNVIEYWNNILDNIKIYIKEKYDSNTPDYQLAFRNMKNYDDNDIIKPIAPKYYFCYDILTDYISKIKLRSIYYIYNNIFISNDNNIKADTLLRKNGSQLNYYCLYIISEYNDIKKKEQAKNLCEYINTQKDIDNLNILMVDQNFFNIDGTILQKQTYGNLGTNDDEILQAFYEIEATGKYYTDFKSIGIFINYFNLIDNTYTLIISDIKAYTEYKFGLSVHLKDDFNGYVNNIAIINEKDAKNLSFDDYRDKLITLLIQNAETKKKDSIELKSIKNIYTFLQTHYLSIKDNTCAATLIKTKTSIFLNFLSKFYVNLLTEVQEIYSHLESILHILNESNICKINGYRLFITDEGFYEILNYIKILSEYTEKIINHNNNINEYIGLIRNVYDRYINGNSIGSTEYDTNPLDYALKVYKYIYDNPNNEDAKIYKQFKTELDKPAAKPYTYYNLIEIILNYYQHLNDIINSSYKIYCDIDIIGKKISNKCKEIKSSIKLEAYSSIIESIKIFNPILVSQQVPPSGPGGPSGYNGGGQGYLVKKEKKNNTYSMSGGSATNSKLLEDLIQFKKSSRPIDVSIDDINKINIEIDKDATYIEETYVFEDCCKECFDETLSPLMRPQFNKFNLAYYPKIEQYDMKEERTNMVTNIVRDPERGRDITIEEKTSFFNWILNYIKHCDLIIRDEILIPWKIHYQQKLVEEKVLIDICDYLIDLYKKMNERFSITIDDLVSYYNLFIENKIYDKLLDYKYFYIRCFIEYNKILIYKINLPAITLDFTNYLDNLDTLKREYFRQVDIYDYELLYIYYNIIKLKVFAIQNIKPYIDLIDIIKSRYNEIPENERTDIRNNAIIANYQTTDFTHFVFDFDNFQKHLNYNISERFFNLIHVNELTQEDVNSFVLITDGMRINTEINDIVKYINIINTRTCTILNILSDVKIKLLLIDVKYYIQIFDSIDIEYIDIENKEELYNDYNNLLSICDILENHKVYYIKYYYINSYDKILENLRDKAYEAKMKHWKTKNTLYMREAEFLLGKIDVKSEKIKDEDKEIIIKNIEYIIANKEFLIIPPDFSMYYNNSLDFNATIIGLNELYDKIKYLKRVYLIIETNNILLNSVYEHYIFQHYSFIQSVLEIILDSLEKNEFNNIIIYEELYNKLLELFHIIILCEEIIKEENKCILKYNFIRKEVAIGGQEGFDIDFITECIQYLNKELEKLQDNSIDINKENYMDILREISNINSSYSCKNFNDYINAKKIFYIKVLNKIPTYIDFIYKKTNGNRDDFVKFIKKIEFYNTTIKNIKDISRDDCDIYKLGKYCYDNLKIMKIIDNILIINIQIYNLVKFNEELYEHKIDKSLLDNKLNSYMLCSSILLSDKDFDNIFNDIDTNKGYNENFTNINAIGDYLIDIKNMEMKRLNNEKEKLEKQYNDKVKELSEEMDKEIKSDKSYAEYISKIIANESSLSTNRNLTRESKGNKSYVPQNHALESEIEELQDKIKGVENPIKESYKKQIKDITEKYNSSIKEYNRRLSVIQDEEGERKRREIERGVEQDRERVRRLRREREDEEESDRIRRSEGEKWERERVERERLKIEKRNADYKIFQEKEVISWGLPPNTTFNELELHIAEFDEINFNIWMSENYHNPKYSMTKHRLFVTYLEEGVPDKYNKMIRNDRSILEYIKQYYQNSLENFISAKIKERIGIREKYRKALESINQKQEQERQTQQSLQTQPSLLKSLSTFLGFSEK
jgi:hypothetical protein